MVDDERTSSKDDTTGDSSPPLMTCGRPRRSALSLWLAGALVVIAIGATAVTRLAAGDNPAVGSQADTPPTSGSSISPGPSTGSVPGASGSPPVGDRSKNEPPVSGVAPQAIMDHLSRDWGLSFQRGLRDRPQMTGGKTDAKTGLSTHAIVTWAKDGKLRSLLCSAMDKKGTRLSPAGVRFLYDCALGAVDHVQQDELRAWLDNYLTGDNLTVHREISQQPRERRFVLEDLQIGMLSSIGLSLSLSGPAT